MNNVNKLMNDLIRKKAMAGIILQQEPPQPENEIPAKPTGPAQVDAGAGTGAPPPAPPPNMNDLIRRAIWPK